jgi:hypothetical protein
VLIGLFDDEERLRIAVARDYVEVSVPISVARYPDNGSSTG